jgi:hypothetical protein
MATTYKGTMANLSLTKLEIVVAQLVWSDSMKSYTRVVRRDGDTSQILPLGSGLR